MFRKSPFSLPAEQYGGARKRVFIGLMLASCLLLCAVIAFSYSSLGGYFSTQSWLPSLSIAVGFTVIIAILWLCLLLIFHIYTGKPLPGVGSVRHITVRLFFPLMELLAKLVGIDRGRVRRSFYKGKQ